MASQHDDVRLSQDITVRLFETLKESNEKLREQAEKQTMAIEALSRHIREGVQLSEIKELLKGEKEQIENVDECTETISDRSDEIIKILKEDILVILRADVIKALQELKTKVTRMITIVTVVVSLLAVTYVFTRSVIDYQQISPSKQNEEILKQMDEIKKTIQEFHK